MTADDIEEYLRFETKYGKQKPSTNILNLVTLLFGHTGKKGRIDLREFRYGPFL